MAFRYTRPPLTQNTVSLVLLAGIFGFSRLPAAAEVWAQYLAAVPDWFAFAGAVYLIHGAVFWGLSLFFSRVERTGMPTWIARYRIQSEVKGRPPAAKVARVLAINQLFWTPLTLLLIWWLLELRGWDNAHVLPSLPKFVAMMAGLTVLSAVWFYVSHRLLHRPWWMRKVHRLHHEFRTTSARAAEYAHWFEFIVGNFGTLAFGVVVLAPSLFTIYVYTLLATYTFVVHHSGFAIPWASWSVHHDWHHYRYREAFGTFGLLDRLLGTDKELRTLKHGDDVK